VLAFANSAQTRHSPHPTIHFEWAALSRLPGSHFATTCRFACPPGGSDRDSVFPANEDFYSRAFDGSVALPAAGYDYDGNWASSTGGTFTR